MIKQIQLRGISRTPSDRLSEDGGLSESLNMYMDTAESAPAIIPKNVTEKIGLPANLQAERIFIHKSANYENYIAVLTEKIVAFTPQIEDEEPLMVLDLVGGEKVIDINSLGNTLVIATTANMYYCLFQNRAYSFLGNKVPFPIIDFTKAEVSDLGEIKVVTGTSVTESGSVGYWFIEDNNNASYIPTVSDWDEDSKDGKAHTGHIKECIEDLKEEIDRVVLESATQQGFLTCPIVVRYDIDLYGSSVSSMPIVIPASLGVSANIDTQKIINFAGASGGYNRTFTSRETVSVASGAIKKYKIHAKLDGEWKVEEWKNLITKVRIFISKPTGWDILPDSTTLSDRETEYSGTPVPGYEDLKNESFYSNGTITFRQDPNFKQTLLSRTAETFLVKEIDLLNEEETDFSEDFKLLMKGDIIDITKFIQPLGSNLESEEGDNVQLETQPMLVDTDMQHYVTATEKLDVFNNRLILTQPSQLIEYDFNKLNAYDINKNYTPGDTTHTYEVTYILAGHTEDKITKKTFTYAGNESSKGFQIFPDSRAYKMLIKYTYGNAANTTYREYDMHPHPYLDCAYYYGSLSMDLSSLGKAVPKFDYPVNAIDDLDNKLFISQINEPFSFPKEGRYTFQTKVLGVAVANTALSQGQFGQFPLYVFTEDGIWAMETASDGSFISQKPLSREVCVNPNSITSIDNAVVFVTSKGVMMIQGSGVANISAYMNGRHYTPNESAQRVIACQKGFDEFNAAITDKTAFTSFMKDASVAYDYVGQRLIFISSKDLGYQYIYKIDTQTWHKISLDNFDRAKPLNSFPDCLIHGNRIEKHTVLVCLDNNSELGAETLRQMVADFFPYDVPIDTFEEFLEGKYNFPLDNMYESSIDEIVTILEAESVNTSVDEIVDNFTYVYDFSTILDPSITQSTAKGILITRPFDLGMPDVFKSITDIKVRGDYDKGNVRYILQGSDNGRDFYTMNSLRGKSWKMFRIFILADLEPTERISWIDIDFEPRYNNKLR